MNINNNVTSTRSEETREKIAVISSKIWGHFGAYDTTQTATSSTTIPLADIVVELDVAKQDSNNNLFLFHVLSKHSLSLPLQPPFTPLPVSTSIVPLPSLYLLS